MIYDLPGEVRLIVPWIDFEGLLDSAFEQIRHYAESDAAVCMRLLRALTDIADCTADPEIRKLVIDRGVRVVDGCAAGRMQYMLPALKARLSSLAKSESP